MAFAKTFLHYQNMLNLNIQVEVKVNTNLTVTHVRLNTPSMSSNAAVQQLIPKKTRTKPNVETKSPVPSIIASAVPRSQSQHSSRKNKSIDLQKKANVHTRRKIGRHTVSPVTILNLVIVILLAFCSGVCRSNDFANSNGFLDNDNNAVALMGVGIKPINHIHSNTTAMRPVDATLDRDWEDFSDTDSFAFYNFQIDETEDNEDNEFPMPDEDLLAIVDNVTHSCLEECIKSNDVYLDDFGLKCSADDKTGLCYTKRCSKGCECWWDAIQESDSCQEVCSSRQFYPYDLPCISACETAQSQYWHLQRLALMESMANATLPILLNSSVGSNNGNGDFNEKSLILKWPIKLSNRYLANLPFNIQFQSMPTDVNATGARWMNLNHYSCSENFDCEIYEELMPFTNYRFRFEILFGDNLNEVLHSPATQVILTAAEGPPLVTPTINSIFALDSQRIALFWAPGEYTNGKLTSYKLILKMNEKILFQKVVPPEKTHHIFTSLQSNTNYTIRLAMVNDEGVGPFVSKVIRTKDVIVAGSTTTPEALDTILVVGEYSIMIKKFVSAVETETIYKSNALISDCAIYMQEKRVFVIDVEGKIVSFSVDRSHEHTINNKLNVSSMKIQPRKIAVDWLNRRLFVAGETSKRTWAILNTDLEGEEPKLVTINLSDPIKNLAVDPINGWLFWSSDAGLARLNLATNVLEILFAGTKIGSFMSDFERFILVAFNTSDHSIYELSYDGSYSQKIDLGGISTKLLEGEYQSLWRFTNRNYNVFLATNGSHIMRQNYLDNENDVWQVNDMEWCTNIWPLEQTKHIQPLPYPFAGAPQNFTALLSSNMAQVKWDPPGLLYHFQTDYAWKQWEYELEIMDVVSNNAFNIRNIKTTHFKVEKLQSNNLYKLRVRVSNGDEGVWSNELLARTWPMGAHKLLWINRNNLWETNEIGGQVVHLTKLLANATMFLQINGIIFYTTLQKRLFCMNIMNPEVNCSFVAENVGGFAFDWRGGKLYWSDVERNCVIRGNIEGNEWELLPIFNARLLEIDSFNGLMYYSTGSRIIRTSLNGEGGEIELYKLNGVESGLIRGLTLNSMNQQLYWIVSKNNEEVLLQWVTLKKFEKETHNQPFHTKILSQDIELGSLQYLNDIESLIWTGRNTSRVIQLKIGDIAYESILSVPEFEEVKSVKLKEDNILYKDPTVFPEMVDQSSIRVDDSYWNDFNVRWTPISTAENFTVQYKILVQYGKNLSEFYTQVTSEPFIRITEFQRSKVEFNITITPYTSWCRGPSSYVQFFAPGSAPGQPKRLRIFVQRKELPLQPSNISAIVRWDAAHNNVDPTSITYRVECWLGKTLYAERNFTHISDNSFEQVIFGDLKSYQTYSFQAQAFTAGLVNGGEKTPQQAVYINPELQSVPLVLYSTNDVIYELDLDLKTHRIVTHISNEIEHLVMIQGEQRLLWVNENVELMSYISGGVPVKLARMRAEVLALTVDWISRIVYWAEMDTGAQAAAIYKLDLCLFDGRVLLGTNIFTTVKNTLLKDLIILPYSHTLMWLQYSVSGSTNTVLMGRNLSDSSITKFKQSSGYVKMFQSSFQEEEESVNLIDSKGRVCVYDVNRQLCSNIMKVYFPSGLQSIIDVDRDSGYLYALTNDSVRAYNRRRQTLEYNVNVEGATKIYAFNHQYYPDNSCLVPNFEKIKQNNDSLMPKLIAIKEQQIQFQMPQLVNTKENCLQDFPGVKYTMTINETTHNSTFNVTSFEKNITISNLKPYTEYNIQLQISTYYQQKLSLPLLFSDQFRVITSVGAPSKVQNFTAYAVSPTEIFVNWSAPAQLNAKDVWYQLHWKIENTTLDAHKTLNQTQFILSKLKPAHHYSIWVRAHSSEEKYSFSEYLTIRTYEIPSTLHLLHRTAYNLTFGCMPMSNVSSLVLVYHPLNGEGSEARLKASPNCTKIEVLNLIPKTKYKFYFDLQYDELNHIFQWPELLNERYIYETLGDRPSCPGKPQIEHVTGDNFKVSWEAAQNNGAPILEYGLEALQSRLLKRKRRNLNETLFAAEVYNQPLWVEEPKPIEDKWLSYCNTSELSCIVKDFYVKHLIVFRVRARNEPYGWGPYSEDSERVAEPFVTPEKRGSLIFAIIAPAAIVSCCVIILVAVRLILNRRIRAKRLLVKNRPSVWSNLSILQQQHLMTISNRAQSVVSHSTWFSGCNPLSDADIALLPHIKWEQITLLKFLGSGAFGEVYEGLIQHKETDDPEKVAIKCLRKGANEFSELLQEAQLMSNFKHENIVRLVGVCFDTESISIIMEYMEGGDLLNYLRDSRPNSNRPVASLQLLDIIGMCIDVASGCAYMEDMHFVHRDLACRNCLISSHEPSKRVVKIGDFGLARDIYKSDYYRKEGEGLMPVRWMSPESLVDGVFTTQSDIWAFGVVCWEILTLGQQPYAARNNVEVLNFVKEGGRLEQPVICPDKLFQLMQECWSIEERPSFRKCLNTLITIKTDVRRVSLGYNIDESDYAIYANSNGVVISNFLTNPLSKVDECDERDVHDLTDSEISAIDNLDLRLNIESLQCKDLELEALNDESQLIGVKGEQDNDSQIKCYINEGVSRL